MVDFARFLAIIWHGCEGVKQICRICGDKKIFFHRPRGGSDLHSFTSVFSRLFSAVEFAKISLFLSKNSQKNIKVKLSEFIYIADMLLLGNFSLICEGCEMRDVHL